MSNIMPFQFESKEIRVSQNADGEIVVVAKDLAEAIGYTWNGSARIQHVPEEWRGVTSVVTPFGEQDMATLTEQGMYFFLARSDKPKALPFQKWLSGEVLPSIRKTGSYSLAGATTSPVKSSPSTPILPWVQKEFKAALSIAKLCGLKGNAAILSASQYVSKLTGTYPLDVADLKHLPSESQAREMTPTEIGKTLGGLPPRAVNILLVDAGLQFKGEDGHWRPTDKGRPFSVLKDTSKRHLSGTPVQQMKWLETVVPMLETARTIGEASLEQDSE